jgi:DNA-binding FrmR family transcriptional regulator
MHPEPEEHDEVITEIRAVKRAISERHDNDVDRLLQTLTAQEQPAGRREDFDEFLAAVPEREVEGTDRLENPEPKNR